MRRLTLALVAALLLPVTASAQSMSDLNRNAVAAFQAGDMDTARSLTKRAVALGPAAGAADPDAYLEALNNLTFLYRQLEPLPQVAFDTLDRALAFGAGAGLQGSQGWFYTLTNQTFMSARAGRTAAAQDSARDQLVTYRGTQLHGQAAANATDAYFAIRDFDAMLGAAREMVAVTGTFGAAVGLEALYSEQEAREAAGDIAAVTALIDTRILWARTLQPDLAEAFAHTALWPKFFLNYQAENFGTAADALIAWASTGSLSAEERAFVVSFAKDVLLLAQLSGYGDRSGVQLEFAELVVAFTQIATPPDDPLRGLALRERAAAETALTQYSRAEATLQDALVVLGQTSEGRADLFLVLEDLAVNAWQRGALQQAAHLFQRADTAYLAALSEGAAPLPEFDLSTSAISRARLALDRDQTQAAETYLQSARSHFNAAAESIDLKRNQLWNEIALFEVAALIAQQAGQQAAAIEAAQQAATLARALYPEGHPGRAQILTNAADLLFVEGARDDALDLLSEAVAIAGTALPPDAPLLIEANTKLALAALTTGDRDTTIATLRRVTEARKSPTYRDSLPEAAENFEMLAWALLDRDTDADTLDEALAALQWTQVSQSSEALAMTAARLAGADPVRATLLRARQDTMLDMTRARSALTASFADGDAPAQMHADLVTRQAGLQTRLDRIEDDIVAAGLEGAGLSRITPLSVAEIQALLGPGEVLITFLLPGLRADRIPGLGGSSNRVIAITDNASLVAPIPEASRSTLNARITAFRCGIAISDPGCDGGGAAGLRGAMLAEDTGAGAGFDAHLAHALYADLFGGVAPLLAGADQVIIVPPADLLRLPFQALVTQPQPDFVLAEAPWFIRSHAISVLPSIPALAQLRATRPRAQTAARRLLGVGDPRIGSGPDADCTLLTLAALRSANGTAPSVYGTFERGIPLADPASLARLSRLPDATCELRAVSDSFGAAQATLLLQDSATETAIKALDDSGALAQFDTLVFATHGLVSGETSATAPGLVLTPPGRATLLDDGLLTSAEVAALTLTADLVVLSACNTAAGEHPQDEGLSGLARGFFFAGARSLMVTHWAVYSEAAVQVSTGVFAARAAQPDQGNAAALRQSILSLLDDAAASDVTRHPAYWAPFAIIGA